MKDQLQTILKEIFRLEAFREWQEEIVESVIEKNDTLVFMPTWGGKSLTYQLPGMYLEGVVLVISPLISLMKDQVDKLNELGIKAELINSTIDKYDISIILNELSRPNPEIKFLYIAPERLNSQEFLRVIHNVNIALVAVDEAHCISQWWHDFRPSYMKIRWFIDTLKQNYHFPIMALTATATKKVRADIVERLWLTNFNHFTAWFDRKNIKIIVREISKKEEKMEKVAEILKKTPWSGIIYCASRKAVKEVYDTLIQNEVKAGMYTGAMTPETREQEQNAFMSDEYKVIVATNAFGMWIDKKDIRFVIHYNLPGSIENYYQEVWRAGRDGKDSFWVVIASFGDTKIQEFFIENTYPSKDEILRVYDHMFAWDKEWEWKWKTVLKTYMTIASEIKLDSDMKVWSALKILEKYGVLRRWVEEHAMSDDFRGRWITLLQEKRKHSHVMIDWKHQEKLKEEAYYKLEQIKKLLFYPRCRKRFILEYFWDEEDLATMGENCGACDYCIEKKNLDSIEVQDYVNTSVFALALDVVRDIDEKIGIVMMTKFLRWSRDAKLVEWNMHKRENFGALWDLDSDLIQALLEALIETDYLYKSQGKYPLLWITETWKIAINRNDFLVDDNRELQHFIRMRLWENYGKKSKTNNAKLSSWTKKVKWETQVETLKLFEEWKTIDEIAKIRELKKQTIESHMIDLYKSWKLWLSGMLKLVSFSNVKHVKDIINGFFKGWYEWLKEIKDTCEQQWYDVARLEINACIAMMEKWDL